jgi:hypothetical protein
LLQRRKSAPATPIYDTTTSIAIAPLRRIGNTHRQHTSARQFHPFSARLTQLRHAGATELGEVWGNKGRGPREIAMTLQTKHAAKDRLAVAKKNRCPQCGEWLLAPDWSEYLNERRVRHTWSCEACSYAFETDVFFAEAA